MTVGLLATVAQEKPLTAQAMIANPAERIHFLRSEIARHDELYYREARPEITDADYDILKHELAELERGFPEDAARLAPLPTREVGDDRRPGFAKIQHGQRMLSLEKVTTEAGLREFDQRLRALLTDGAEPDYVVEPKFDGLAVSALYEQGLLTRLVTRGNGGEGDDVTAAVRRIHNLPMVLSTADPTTLPRSIEIRGEVFMAFAEFDRINREQDEMGRSNFASPRNLAAGTLKSADAEGRKLEIVFYGLGKVEPEAVAASQMELLAQLGAWGLPTIENARPAGSIAAAWQAVQAIERTRSSLPYPIDGAVVKLNSFAGRRLAGETPSAPRWAIAFKYAPQRVATRLKGITLQVGRTGVVTPVAELEPVALAGATIARATLHNAEEIARRDVRVGDIVFVERHGEIIPAVVGVDLARRSGSLVRFVFPSRCPSCGESLTRSDGAVDWRCVNQDCPARRQRRILHFASAECLGIKGLGEATVEGLVQRGVVRDPCDLYRLRREQLVADGGMSEKAADALLAQIENSKTAPLGRVIQGLGIPGVGRATASALAQRFGALEALSLATEKDLIGVAGIGGETAREIVSFLAEPDVRRQMQELTKLGVAPTRSAPSAGPVAGKIFVLSGALPTLTHARATELIEAAGGKVTDSVTRRTDFVVAGAEISTKVKRARVLDVPVIEEARLLALLRGEADL